MISNGTGSASTSPTASPLSGNISEGDNKVEDVAGQPDVAADPNGKVMAYLILFIVHETDICLNKLGQIEDIHSVGCSMSWSMTSDHNQHQKYTDYCIIMPLIALYVP